MRPVSLVISATIKAKLKNKHGVSVEEVEQCFYNRTHNTLVDTRERHKTQPPTEWFIAKTDMDRLLKVVFVLEDGKVFIKSCFEADNKSIRIYTKLAK